MLTLVREADKLSLDTYIIQNIVDFFDKKINFEDFYTEGIWINEMIDNMEQYYSIFPDKLPTFLEGHLDNIFNYIDESFLSDYLIIRYKAHINFMSGHRGFKISHLRHKTFSYDPEMYYGRMREYMSSYLKKDEDMELNEDDE